MSRSGSSGIPDEEMSTKPNRLDQNQRGDLFAECQPRIAYLTDQARRLGDQPKHLIFAQPHFAQALRNPRVRSQLPDPHCSPHAHLAERASARRDGSHCMVAGRRACGGGGGTGHARIETNRTELNHPRLGGVRPDLGFVSRQIGDHRGLSSRRATRQSVRVSSSTGPTRASESVYASRIAAELSALGINAAYAGARGLVLQPEAQQLVVARTLSDGRELRLTPETASAWAAMRDAAAAADLTLLLISGFRSVSHQRDIVRRKLDAGETLDAILSVNAAPGYSEHHTGRAIDVGTPGCPPLSEAFETTGAFAWLNQLKIARLVILCQCRSLLYLPKGVC